MHMNIWGWIAVTMAMAALITAIFFQHSAGLPRVLGLGLASITFAVLSHGHRE